MTQPSAHAPAQTPADAARRRPLLPLAPVAADGVAGGPHGSRSAMTCKFRCGDACFHPAPNTSGNPEFRVVAERALARRSVLRAGGAGLGALAVTGLVAPGAAAAPTPAARRRGRGRDRRSADVGRDAFRVVAPNRADDVTVPRGYRSDIVIGWGDPVTRRAPRFDVLAQTGDAQYEQFGYNCDYVGVFHTSRNHALLAVNHEYTNEELMFPAGTDERVVKEVGMAAHGLSVVEVRRGSRRGSWETVPVRRTKRNRRISLRTRFEVTGPAAGHPLLRTSRDLTGRRVFGTLNNCSGGHTPWGTVLSGEENFNQYFETEGELDPRYAAQYARYGISATPDFARGWRTVDGRFDLAEEPHEPHRFGWVVEIDPYDPGSVPQKHTMLGRFKHEGANIAVADDGRVVAYSGDDERGDYVYKFVSRKRMRRGDSRAARRHNMTLLHEGTLYVGRFDGEASPTAPHDGAGTWVPLASDRESFVPGMSVAEVLVFTRLAADSVGATRMDRPEDIEPNPVTGKVYCALTNNSQRGSTFPVSGANPVGSSLVRDELGQPLTRVSGNRNGYVLEISPRGGDHTSTAMDWDLMLVCGDPTAPESYFAGFPAQLVSPISCPDNVAFDAQGNLWVSTDGNVIGSNDGLFRVPTEGHQRGFVQQFLTVPLGAETCGPLISDDQRSVWIAVQHPGEADGSTFEAPASTWPTGRYPRPSVVVTYRG